MLEMGTISKRRSQEQPRGDFCSVTHARPAPEQLGDPSKATCSSEGLEPSGAASLPRVLLGSRPAGGLGATAWPSFSEAAEEVENGGVLAEMPFRLWILQK